MKLFQFSILWQNWLFKYNTPYNYYNFVALNFDFEPLFLSLNDLEINTKDEDKLTITI
ncbi:MAG: hypothetical protein ACXACK_04890 [Candidatus Hodarchaeales archaeon]|jgi:hypothetical protein